MKTLIRQNYNNIIIIRSRRHKDPAGSPVPRYKSFRHICDNRSLKICRDGVMTTCIGKHSTFYHEQLYIA